MDTFGCVELWINFGSELLGSNYQDYEQMVGVERCRLKGSSE